LVEVFLVWGDGPSASVLAGAFVAEGERFSIGEDPGCDAFVPAEMLGMSRAEVIRWDDRPRVVPPWGACSARVRVDGHDVLPEPWCLAEGEAVDVTFGGFVIRARLVETETLPRAKLARDGLAGVAASFVLHTVCLLALAAQPPPPTDDFQVHRELVQRLLAASDARELTTPPPRAHSVERRSSPARSPVAPTTSARSEARPPRSSREAPADVAPGPAARVAAKREALGFGFIAILSADAKSLEPSRWGEPTALDAPSDRVMAMFTEPVGETSGGLSLSGTGLGGGGKGAGIHIAEVGVPSRRTQERLDPPSRPPSEGDLPHVLDNGRSVDPNDGPSHIQPIPRPVIERVVRAHSSRFRMCRDLGRRRNPSLAGRVNVEFTIGAGGAVREARDAGGDLDDDTVRTCVVRTFLALPFPPPMDGVPQKVLFPIVLRRDPR
jgi:hypothetical protein